MRPVTEEEAVRLFWLGHARLGVLLSLAAIAQLGGYAAFGADAHSRGLLLAIGGAAVVATLVVGRFAASAVTRPRYLTFFFAWSVAVIVAILAGAAVDGGDESPVNVSLFLPLMYAGLAYPPLAVLGLGALEVTGFCVISTVDATPSEDLTVLFATTLVLATLMATRAARNRDRQRHQLRALAMRLQVQATHDPLTGCLNRRGFDEELERELTRALRYDRPLTLLLVDVDRLKQVNDDLGHAAGDRALSRVAGALAAVGRRSDIAARLGGDEFALLAPETSTDEADELAARVHRALQDEDTEPPVTVSIGIAQLAAGDSAGADLVRHADVALYDAKVAGRNRTHVFPTRRTMPSSRAIPAPRVPEPASDRIDHEQQVR